MVDPKKPPQKKSSSFFGEMLDGVAWGVRQAALPIPDGLIGKKKEKIDPKKKK